MSAASRAHDEAMKAAEAESVRRIPRQKSYADLVKIKLSIDASAAALVQFYMDVLTEYQNVAPATIQLPISFQGVPVGIPGGVPITGPSVKEDDAAFHIIQLVNDGVAGSPYVEIPVRQMDNYSCGFRVLFPYDDVDVKRWNSFAGAELPVHLFREVRPSGYPMAYAKIEQIKIRDGILATIYDHLVAFENNPITTTEGKVLVDTFIFICGEGQRFLWAQHLALDNIKCRTPASPTTLMADLIREWSDISVPILKLWLIQLAEDMGLLIDAKNREALGDLRVEVESDLVSFEAKYGTLITFRNDEGAFGLSQLAGGALILIKYRSELMIKILMRIKGYRKVFYG